jgi:hypothetical protein
MASAAFPGGRRDRPRSEGAQEHGAPAKPLLRCQAPRFGETPCVPGDLSGSTDARASWQFRAGDSFRNFLNEFRKVVKEVPE